MVRVGAGVWEDGEPQSADSTLYGVDAAAVPYTITVNRGLSVLFCFGPLSIVDAIRSLTGGTLPAGIKYLGIVAWLQAR